jgi:CRISPR-associated Cas5-like protein
MTEERPTFLSPTNRRWLIGLYYGGLVAIILVMWMVSKYVTPRLEATAAAVVRQDGYAYYFKAPQMVGIADTEEFPTRSAITLCENSRELGPPHSAHSDIRNLGRGRFSHWTGVVIFSSSDGSDPTENGREYRVRLDGKCGKP